MSAAGSTPEPTGSLAAEVRSTVRAADSRPGAVRRAGVLCVAMGLLMLGFHAFWLHLAAPSPPAILPPAGEVIEAGRPFRFAVVSDTRGNMAVFEDGMARIKDIGVDLILHGGDIAQRLTERQFNWVLHELDEMELSVPFCAVPGNHDTGKAAPDAQGRYPLYSNAFGPRRYWFAFGDALFVAFDDSSETVTAEDLTWLDGVLQRHRSEYGLCFVFFHVPPRTDGLRHTLNEEDTQALMHLLSSHGVSAVFTGHLHSYAQYEVAGVPVYSTGGLGEGGPPGEPHSFLVCDVGADGAFSVRKPEVPVQPNSDYPEYAFRVKFPCQVALAASVMLLMFGTALIRQDVCVRAGRQLPQTRRRPDTVDNRWEP